MKRLMISMVLLLTLLDSACTSRIAIEGVVEDSGKPVAEAKVIATAWTHGIFDRNCRQYGTLTDSKGSFSLNVKTPFSYSEVYLEILSPENRYFFKKYTQANELQVEVTLGEQPHWRLLMEEQLEYTTYESSYICPIEWIEPDRP